MATLKNSADAVISSTLTTGPQGGAVDLEPTSKESREEAIRRAAYAASERRGFKPGFEEEDWLTAEREFDELVGNRRSSDAA